MMDRCRYDGHAACVKVSVCFLLCAKVCGMCVSDLLDLEDDVILYLELIMSCHDNL